MFDAFTHPEAGPSTVGRYTAALKHQAQPLFGEMERKISMLLSGCDGTHDFVRDGANDHLSSSYEARKLPISAPESLSSSPVEVPSIDHKPYTPYKSEPVGRPSYLVQTKTTPNFRSSELPDDRKSKTMQLLASRRATTGHFDPSKDARLLAI